MISSEKVNTKQLNDVVKVQDEKKHLPRRGFEPPPSEEDTVLSRVRLPIPPPRHCFEKYKILFEFSRVIKLTVIHFFLYHLTKCE